MSEKAALTGQTVGAYRLVRRLGHGAMGFVYEAVEVEERIPVAIKLFAGIVDPLGRERFMQEARLASRVQSPHLVRIYDAGDADGKLYIAYELMEERDLDQRLDEEACFPAVRAVEVAVHIARGLEDLHAHEVLHRDVKPANIFFRPDDGRWVIGDLGVAKDTTGHSLRTGSGIMMGTPEYIAPEYTRGEPITAAADQYALGVVLYELLCGVRPYEAGSPEEVFRRQQTEAPSEDALPAHEGLRTAVVRMLHQDPAERFPSMTACREALEALEGLEALPFEPPEEGERAEARDTRGRRRRARRSTGRTRPVERPGQALPVPPWAVGVLAVGVVAVAWLLL